MAADTAQWKPLFPRQTKTNVDGTKNVLAAAKKELQGKVARLLSSKLTIAARADFYTKKDISEELLKGYKEKLKQIKGEE